MDRKLLASFQPWTSDLRSLRFRVFVVWLGKIVPKRRHVIRTHGLCDATDRQREHKGVRKMACMTGEIHVWTKTRCLPSPALRQSVASSELLDSATVWEANRGLCLHTQLAPVVVVHYSSSSSLLCYTTKLPQLSIVHLTTSGQLVLAGVGFTSHTLLWLGRWRYKEQIQGSGGAWKA